MNVIIDSNIFIASFDKSDSLNKSIDLVFDKLKNNEIQIVFITNYVLVEVISFLLKKLSFEIVLEAYNYLTQTDQIKIVYVDEFMEDEIKKLFLKYKSLTLTDCSLIALSNLKEIKEIYSFDKGFDKVKEITRLEN